MRKGPLDWVPVLAWAGLSFALSAQPDLRFLEDAFFDFVLRKVGHAGVFGILALLLWRAVGMTTVWRQPRTPAVALGLTAGYAITDELHQGLVGCYAGVWVTVAGVPHYVPVRLMTAGTVRSRIHRSSPSDQRSI